MIHIINCSIRKATQTAQIHRNILRRKYSVDNTFFDLERTQGPETSRHGPKRTGQRVAKYDQTTHYRNTNLIKEPSHNGVPVVRDTNITLDFCDEVHYALHFDKIDEVIRIYEEIIEDGSEPTEYDFYLYLYALFRQKHHSRVYFEYKTNPITSTIDCRMYHTVLYSTHYSGKREEALKFFYNTLYPYYMDKSAKGSQIVSENERARVYQCVYNDLVASSGNSEKVHSTLSDQVASFPYSVNQNIMTTIITYLQEQKYEHTNDVVKLILTTEILISDNVLSDLALSFPELNHLMNKSESRQGKENDKYIILRTKIDSGYVVGAMNAAMVDGRIDLAESLFYFVTANISFYKDPYDLSNTMAKCYLQAKDVERLERHLEWMNDIHIPLTTECANLIMHYYQSMKSNQKVIELYKEMVKQWIQPNFFTYQMLLKSYEELNDLEGIEELLKKFKEEKAHHYYALREVYYSVLRVCKERNDNANLKEYAEQFALRYPELYKDEVEPFVQNHVTQ